RVERAVAQPQQVGGDPDGFETVPFEHPRRAGQRALGAEPAGAGPVALGGAQRAAVLFGGAERGLPGGLARMLVADGLQEDGGEQFVLARWDADPYVEAGGLGALGRPADGARLPRAAVAGRQQADGDEFVEVEGGELA